MPKKTSDNLGVSALRKSRRPLIIASRSSLLARRQAELVGQLLLASDPSLQLDYRWIESDPSPSPAAVPAKDLFVRAVQQTLLQHQADLAVHSLKDLPVQQTLAQLTIAAVPPRADVRDCLVSRAGYASLTDLPSGAVIGTSSPRRAAQIRRLRPDLQVQPLRGNIETRLRRVLDEAAFDAAVLSLAALQRAGFHEHARCPIDPDQILPAPGQGALALECRLDDHVTLRRVLPVNDAVTAAAVQAERQLVALLGGDCHMPVAALVDLLPPDQAASQSDLPLARQDQALPFFRLRARVLSPDGSTCLQTQKIAPSRQVARLVRLAAQDLLAQGAADLLKNHR